jgi:glutamyl-tRNA reductase
MTTAAEIEPLSADVSRLFHSAIRSGRRARDETDIGKNALTVSYTGVRLLQQTLGDLSDLSVLLVGAGEAGRLVADALTSSGVGQIKVANRTAARADEIAVDLDAEAVPFEDMAGAIKTSDVVITAVDHDEHVLSVDDVSSAVRNRERSLFVLDLGVPRNVDPLVARVDGVILHNIDDLTQVATENLSGRQAAAVNAEKVVEDELARFAVWWDSREATSVIKDVREMAEATRLRELDKALKLMPGLSEQQRANVEAMSRSLVAKLLHQPTVRLKDPAGRPYLQAIKELFGP